MISLYPFQNDCTTQLRESFRRYLSVLLVLPTGAGKTVLFSHFASKIAAAGQRIVILVHRDELLQQVSETLEKFDVKHGLIAAGEPYDRRYLVHVASVMTLVKRLDKIVIPDWCIPDEAHHCISLSTWGRVFTTWRAANPRLRILGVTATPCRLSGEGLGIDADGPFEHMVVGPSVRTLIDDGYLSKYKIYVPPTVIDRSMLHKRAGDFIRGEASAAINKPKIIGDVIDTYKVNLDGAPSALFAPSVDSAGMFAQKFRDRGYQSVCVDGKMDKNIRRSIISDFKRGAINVLTNCNLLTEGVDCPGMVGMIDVSPTESLSLDRQKKGRVIRKMQGIEFKIIIDHVGNSGSMENGEFIPKHGMPDEEYEWDLNGVAKKSKSAITSPSPRQCGQCFAMSPAFASQCRECGQPFTAKPREVKQVEGELQEVDPEVAKRKASVEQGTAKDLDSLIELGRQRYGPIKGPRWARHVWDAREKKKQAQLEARYQDEAQLRSAETQELF